MLWTRVTPDDAGEPAIPVEWQLATDPDFDVVVAGGTVPAAPEPLLVRLPRAEPVPAAEAPPGASGPAGASGPSGPSLPATGGGGSLLLGGTAAAVGVVLARRAARQADQR